MIWPERTGARGLPAAAASGALLAAAYPHPDLYLLAFVALVPFLLGLEGCSPARALGRGYACGAVFFAILLYWVAGVMVGYGDLPWIVAVPLFALLVFYCASYVALFAVALAAAWRRSGPLVLAAAPFTWVALELARGRLLSGFPWGLLGYSQSRNLPLLQAAGIGGVYLVSFFVLGVNAALALMVLRWRCRGAVAGVPARSWRGVLPAAGALLGLAGAAHALGVIVLREPAGGIAGAPIPVAAIQANVPQEIKWRGDAAAGILADLERMTRQAAGGGARLIVWPESSSPYAIRVPAPVAGGEDTPGVLPHDAYVERLRGLADATGATLVFGTVDYRVAGGELRAYNSAAVIAPGTGPGPSYDKVRLVPFGEYVPLRRILFFVDRMVRGAIADFAPGGRLDPIPTPWGGAATFICYEAVFPEHVRRLAARDPAFLVNITNDAWFGRTSAAAQHLAMAVVRAVESGRDLVRAANTGISALVDARGRIVARTGLFETAVLTGRVTPRRGKTPYVRSGDLFAWACAILALTQTAALRAAFARRGT